MRVQGGYGFRTYDDAAVYIDELASRDLERPQQEGVDVSSVWKPGDLSLILPADRLQRLGEDETTVALIAWDCADDVGAVRQQVTAETEHQVLRTDCPDAAVDLGIDVDR